MPGGKCTGRIVCWEDHVPGGSCAGRIVCRRKVCQEESVPGGSCAGRKLYREDNMLGGSCAMRKVRVRKNSLGKSPRGMCSGGIQVTIKKITYKSKSICSHKRAIQGHERPYNTIQDHARPYNIIKGNIGPQNRSLKAMLGPTRPQMVMNILSNDFVTLS